MAKDWDELAGERGKKVDTSRLGRALKIGRVAARFGGSMLKAQITRRGEPEKGREAGGEAMANAAMKHADRILDVMSEMKGAAMKVGQLLSTDPDLVAPEFAERLTALQNKSVPMDYVTVSAQIEAQLHQPIESIFRFFDPEPLGSASIGQVHRATLFDGRDVAVKVQYPGIRGSLDSDLKNMGSLLKVGRVFMTKDRADEFMVEVRESILGEADYLLEAATLTRVGAILADYDWVVVPEPIMEFSAEQVLTMTYIEGVKVDEALDAMSQPERDDFMTKFVSLYIHMLHEKQILHADPHPGNFLLTEDGRLGLLDHGCVRDFRPEMTDGILQLLAACMAEDWDELRRLYRHFEFGKPGGTLPSNDVLRDYHQIILEPLLTEGVFDFGDWTMHGRARGFVLKNMEMARVMPPAELLMYFRVLAGVKGLLTRSKARISVNTIAVTEMRKRGFID